MTATRALEVLLIAPLSQVHVAFDTHPTATSSIIGSLPLGRSMSLPPWAFDPVPTLPFGLPADGTLAMQAQHLMALA